MAWPSSSSRRGLSSSIEGVVVLFLGIGNLPKGIDAEIIPWAEPGCKSPSTPQVMIGNPVTHTRFAGLKLSGRGLDMRDP